MGAPYVKCENCECWHKGNENDPNFHYLEGEEGWCRFWLPGAGDTPTKLARYPKTIPSWGCHQGISKVK